MTCATYDVGAHGGEIMYYGSVCFRGELCILNCYDICMCVVKKQFELLEVGFDSAVWGPDLLTYLFSSSPRGT